MNDQNERFSTCVYSIITVCLNDLKAINLTYSSLSQQMRGDYEWLVIDGGSSDGTQQFLEKIKMQNLRWISESDRGLYDAMNKGIAMSAGEYLLFLNAGDTLADAGVLKKISNEIEHNNMPDFIFGDASERTVGGGFLYKKARSHRYLWYGMFTHHQAMLYKRSVVAETRYRLEYPIGADYAFTAEVLLRCRNIIRLPYAVCTFSQGGLSSRSVVQGARDQWAIRRDIMHVNVVFRLLIRLVHACFHVIKTLFPAIYRRARFS